MREFDINNDERISEIISVKLDNAYCIPLYVKMYNKLIDLRDIDEIDNFIPSGFKVGFGVRRSIFDKCSFPIKYLNHFDILRRFRKFNEKINNDEEFFVFESSEPYEDINHDMFKQIDYYYWMIRKYLEDNMRKIREDNMKRIKEELNK